MFNELRSTSSTLDKLAILKTANDQHKAVFKACYDQGITYGLNYSYINYATVGSIGLLGGYAGLFSLLNLLATRQLYGNTARACVDTFASQYGDLIKLICNKDLDCGVSVGLLDKAFGKNFIKKFKVQLAEELPIEKVKLPICGEIKYNGVRITALKLADGSVELYTRNGNLIPFPALQELIAKCMPCSTMLDGELTLGNSSKSNHTSVSGLVTSAMRGSPIVTACLVYNVFDTMSLQQFNTQTNNAPYNKRRAELEELFTQAGANMDYELVSGIATMRVTTRTMFTSHKVINEVFETVVEQGYEGLILKPNDHLYKFKRTTDWIKMKTWKDCDLLCTGTTEGEGKYAGMIGGLACQGFVGDLPDGKPVEVVVASGLTDADRAEDPSYYIGRTIEVQYNEIIVDNTTGKWSLFLPKFIQVRSDK